MGIVSNCPLNQWFRYNSLWIGAINTTIKNIGEDMVSHMILIMNRCEVILKQEDFLKQLQKVENEKEYKIQSISLRIEGKLFERINRVSRFNKTAIFILLLTNLELLIQRYVNYGDLYVILGGIEVVQEYFGDQNFKTALSKVKEDFLQDYSFSNIHLQEGKYIQFCVLNGEDDDSNDYELSFRIMFQESAIFLNIIYDEAIYDKRLLDVLINNYYYFLKENLENSTIMIKDINLNRKKAEISLVHGRDQRYTEDIVTLFEKNVANNPQKIAIIEHNGEVYSYDKINKRINQFARKMKKYNIDYQNRVAIIEEDKVREFIFMMASLKSGIIFSLLNSSYPKERQKLILDMIKPKYILSNNDWFDEYGIICINEEGIEGFSTDNFPKISDVNKVAYIQFTSGTTGKPKGIVVKNSSLNNSINWRIEEYKFAANMKALQLLSSSFDGYFTSILTPILSGVTTVVLDQLKSRDPLVIGEIIEKYKIGHFITVPILLMNILEVNEKEKLESLEVVTLVGEEATEQLFEIFERKGYIFSLINEYGPSENTIVSTFYRNMNKRTKNIVGKPICNVKIYVLDKNDYIQPIGGLGEICLGGNGLAHSYLEDTALTQEKFFDLKGERVYRTGDLGYIDGNGNLVFKGRKDRQVKVRGIRIELDDIKTNLLTHKLLKDVQIVLSENPKQSIGKQIFAFAILKNDCEEVDLRKYLLDKLPLYMIPEKIFIVDKFPIYSEKVSAIDLIKLVDKEYKDKELVSNDIERKLYEIWCAVLEETGFSVEDNFFEIGGHSIKAIILLSQIMDKMDTKISLQELYANPTIKKMAMLMESKDKKIIKEEVKVVKRKEAYFTSDLQKRIYIASLLEKNISYNIPIMIKKKGELDEKNIIWAINELFNRHEILRTTFFIENGKLMQKVENPTCLDIPSVQSNNLQRELEGFVRPFQFDDIMFRCKIIHISNNEHYILMDFHHIIMDGASLNIILREFDNLVNNIQLDKIEYQYKEYVYWRKERLNSEEVKSQKDYWVNKMKNLPLPFDFVSDYNSEQCSKEHGNIVREIAAIEKSEVLYIIKNKEISVMSIFLCAISILLKRLCDQDNMIIGLPVTCRKRQEFFNVIGMFVNTLPLIISIKDEKLIEDTLRNITSDLNELISNSEYPIDEIIENTKEDGTGRKGVLYNVLFNFLDGEIYSFQNFNYTVNSIYNQYAKYDMIFNIEPKHNKYIIEVEYRTCIFAESSIRQILHYLNNILIEIISDLKTKIREVTIENEKDRSFSAAVLSNYVGVREKDKTIIDIFNNTVEKFADRIAIYYKNTTWTYKKMNEQVNKLCHLLITEGIGIGDFVGVHYPRNTKMYISILAILKAGATYVPISIDTPDVRIAYILEELSIRYIITTLELEKHFDDFDVDCIIWDYEILKEYSQENPKISYNSSMNIYAIYTSGTSGVPKGVVVKQRNLVCLLIALQKKYALCHNDRILLKTSINFDVSMSELFWGLLSGAAIVIMPEGLEKFPTEISKIIQRYDITYVNFVPTMFNMWVETLKQGKFTEQSSLKYILLAGEIALAKSIYECYKILPNVRIVNLYGPTEATIYATAYEIPSNRYLKKIPIGKPLLGVGLSIINRKGDLQPPCMPGELVIEGTGVVEGYFHKTEYSNKSFFKRNTGQAYKTGDIVKLNLDGELEYIGRRDRQVKVRGVRIELEEVEKNLLEYEKIGQAVVMAIENSALVAFLVCNKPCTIEEIKNHLLHRLPFSMLPMKYYILSEIPMLANGKTDERALLNYVYMSQKKQEQSLPDNEEELLLKIWRKLLKNDEINIFSDFFEFGGNSILAIKSEIMLEKVGFGVSAKDIYEHRTIDRILRGNGKEGVMATHENGDVFITEINTFNGFSFGNCFYSAIFPVVNKIFGTITPIIANTFFWLENIREGIRLNFKNKINLIEYLNKLDVSVIVYKNVASVCNKIEKDIDKEKCVICYLDCFYLSIRKEFYLKKHFVHSILIYGYNKKEKQFLVLEHLNSNNLAYSHYKISYHELREAYNSKFVSVSEFVQEDYYAILAYPKQNGWNVDLAKKTYLNILEEYSSDTKSKSTMSNYKCKLMELSSLNKCISESHLEEIAKIVNLKKAEYYIAKEFFEMVPNILFLANEKVKIWNGILKTMIQFNYNASGDIVDTLIRFLEKAEEIEEKYTREAIENLNSY